MSDIAGFDLTPNSGTTLRKVLKLSLEPHMEMFEGISAAATKVSLLLFFFIENLPEKLIGIEYICFSIHVYILLLGQHTVHIHNYDLERNG